jgi:hypothetical protein
MAHLPLARKENLIVKEVADEVLVYDLDRDKAHCLNHTAALVWNHCDGETTVASVRKILEQESETPVGDEVVWLAVKQLEKFHLLQPSAMPARMVSRRDLVLKYAPAALALPMILSIAAPTRAQAASCKPDGAGCESGTECCSGCCGNSSCVPFSNCL